MGTKRKKSVQNRWSIKPAVNLPVLVFVMTPALLMLKNRGPFRDVIVAVFRMLEAFTPSYDAKNTSPVLENDPPV